MAATLSVRARSSLVLLLAAFSTPAHAAFSLGLVGIDTFATPSASQSQTSYTFVARSALGAGLEAQFTISGGLGLELGALYVTRKYAATVVAQATGVTTIGGDVYAIPAFEFPLLVTYSPVSWVSLGLGVYYASILDHVTVTDAQGDPGFTQSLADTALTNQDYGAIASLRLLVPVLSLGGLRGCILAEGQALYGIANTAVSSAGAGEPNSFRYRDLQVLLGFAIGEF